MKLLLFFMFIVGCGKESETFSTVDENLFGKRGYISDSTSSKYPSLLTIKNDQYLDCSFSVSIDDLSDPSFVDGKSFTEEAPIYDGSRYFVNSDEKNMRYIMIFENYTEIGLKCHK